MIWRGRPLHDLTDGELAEAMRQNSRLAAVVLRGVGPNVRKEWERKARALKAEGLRRCPVEDFRREDAALWREVDQWLAEVAPDA